MRIAIPLVLALSGCSLYFDDADPVPPTTEPTAIVLQQVRSIAGELPDVVGIDDDGTGGLWIAYRQHAGDFYDPADVRLVHLDPTDTKIAEFRYMDELTRISGLAVSDEAVWLNYAAAGSGHNMIRKIDKSTGEILATFGTESGIEDIEAGDDGTMILSNYSNWVSVIDRSTGGEIDRRGISGDVIFGSTQRGVALVDGRWWLSAQMDANVIRIFDETGAYVGRATTDVLDEGFSYERGLQLAWDGTQLIVAHDNQITWLLPDRMQ